MPLRSMTGYGRAEGRVRGGHLTIAIKSVNHKNLDVRMSTPQGFGEMEQKIQHVLRARLGRGRLSLHCEFARARAMSDGESAAALGMDEEKFARVVGHLQGLKMRHGLSGVIGFQELEPYRALFAMDQREERELPEWSEVRAVLSAAIDEFDASRRKEGEGIEELFRDHLRDLGERRVALTELRPLLLDGYHDRLRERLEALLKVHGGHVDQERIISEVHIFADKTDIAEELQRAGAHIEQLTLLLDVEGEALGKKLDFYLQEMIRETNTMASKSNFSDLTVHVVEMKARIEQLREQAANVE